MNLTKTSWYLNPILRHRPEVIGIILDKHGWTNVEDIIKGISRTHTMNMDILEEIVRTDEKGRHDLLPLGQQGMVDQVCICHVSGKIG